MPPPRVQVSVNTGRFLSESIVTLICTASLQLAVNTGETVVTSWFDSNGQLRNSLSITISNALATANGVFQSSVTFSNFVPSVHNGEYICNATVIPSSSNIVGNSVTGRRRVMVSGKCISNRVTLYSSLMYFLLWGCIYILLVTVSSFY